MARLYAELAVAMGVTAAQLEAEDDSMIATYLTILDERADQ